MDDAAAVWLAPGELHPWDANPRVNDEAVGPVARSIEALGFGAPIVARAADHRIIAGHTRWKAAIQLGLDSVPVRLMDVTEEQADQLALADNRLGEIATWDEEGLAEVLRGFDPEAVQGLGWDEDEMAALLALGQPGGGEGGQGQGEPTARPTAPPWPKPAGAVVHLGDCLEHLRTLPDNSVDAVVTDPPYGLSAPPDVAEVLQAWLAGETYEHSGGGFMGRGWDSFVPGPAVWREVCRVLKPGGWAVIFAGTRTVDLMGIAARLGGLEVRDEGRWLYWNGFPKGKAVGPAIDQHLGHEREVVGARRGGIAGGTGAHSGNDGVYGFKAEYSVAAPATPEAAQWEGYDVALKPAGEPWLLCRKPLGGTVAANVLRWSVGGLNIDGCRYAVGDTAWPGPQSDSWGSHPGVSGNGVVSYQGGGGGYSAPEYRSDGRFPANVYACPKASRSERERGCEHLPPRAGHEAVDRAEGSAGLDNPRAGAGRTKDEVRNHHPTVKPVRLMRWLVRLVCPPGGTVLDPFTGSGTTGIAAVLEGRGFDGCELEEEHLPIAEGRIAHAAANPDEWAETAPGYGAKSSE